MFLKDKVALITGSSGSIGKATAVAFAKEGADIYLHYNKSMTECNKISKEIENYNRKCYLIKADLTSMRDIENMFGFIQKTTGSLDIFCLLYTSNPYGTPAILYDIVDNYIPLTWLENKQRLDKNSAKQKILKRAREISHGLSDSDLLKLFKY